MTGASHSSVKRYRELARNSPTNGLERELLLDGPHLLFEAHESGVADRKRRVRTGRLERSVRFATLAEQLLADGADVFIVSRKTLESMSPVRSPSGAVGIARRTLPSLTDALASAERAGRRRPRCSGSGQRRRHHADCGSRGRDGVRRDRLARRIRLGWKALRGSMGSALRLPIARGEIARRASRASKRRASRRARSCLAAGVRCSMRISESRRR